MGLLYFLEGLRTPAGDAFFSMITHLGEETLFIVVGLLIFWCVDKLQGYYLLTVGLTGTVINQFLKLWFRIPRPWVKDPNFTIVESARAEATGYSFPSGHTQNSVGIFGSIARWNKQPTIRVICLAVCVLIPLSRLYLGVHTLADVGVSIAVALVLIFGIYPWIQKATDDPRIMRKILVLMVGIAAAYVAFVEFYHFPADIDNANLANGTKNAYTMLGCLLGIWLDYEIDIRYINFSTKAVWWAQILKLVIGLVILLGIKAGLKTPLLAICNGHDAANGIRYFLMVVFAGCVWPLTFKFWGETGKN